MRFWSEEQDHGMWSMNWQRGWENGKMKDNTDGIV
jgi:hypothetical protein